MTVAIDASNGSATLDVGSRVPKVDRLGFWRTLAVIAFSALSAGGLFSAMNNLGEPDPGSAVAATEQLLRRPVEPAAIGAVVVMALIVTLAGAAAVVTLRRHAD